MSHPTPLVRRATAGALTLALALVGVAACGDDDSTSADDTTTTAPAETTTTGSSDGDSTTTTGETTTTAGSAGSGEGFCGDIAAFDATLDSVDEAYSSGDPEEIALGFTSILEPMQAVDAPLPIRDDWNTMVTAFEGLARLLDGIDYSADDVDAQFEALGEALDEQFEGIDEAADRVEAFVLSECDIELGD
ncbi:MAG: hypothetical protein ACSLFP_13290 [Acidimicrobiales bacterium]